MTSACDFHHIEQEILVAHSARAGSFFSLRNSFHVVVLALLYPDNASPGPARRAGSWPGNLSISRWTHLAGRSRGRALPSPAARFRKFLCQKNSRIPGRGASLSDIFLFDRRRINAQFSHQPALPLCCRETEIQWKRFRHWSATAARPDETHCVWRDRQSRRGCRG